MFVFEPNSVENRIDKDNMTMKALTNLSELKTNVGLGICLLISL